MMRDTIALVFILSAAILPAPAQTGTPQPARNPYTISYLGRTFGYFRVPSIQPESGASCDARSVDLPEVKRALDQIAASGISDALVSLGDNFSPELEARAILRKGRLQPKDQLTFDYLNSHQWIPYDEKKVALSRSLAVGQGIVPFDNVGCFFKLAGFDAIVPGKQDFHYGPERLQELARYLADPQSGHTVQMLGANLTISTVVTSPPDQTSPGPKPANYATVGPKGSHFNVPSTPLPYMRLFTIQSGVDVTGIVQSSGAVSPRQKLSESALAEATQKTVTPLYAKGWICQGQLGPRFDPSGCDDLGAPAIDGTSLHFSLPKTKYGLYPDASALQPGVNYYVCASSQSTAAGITDKNTICQPTFQFHFPFFQWGASSLNPKPYAVLQNVVIFGVVDQDLTGQIGALNESWQNASSLFQTSLDIVDPHVALDQLLQTCREDPACAGKPHILLAQMPRQRAERLAAHLHAGDGFNLVLSEADDSAATGDITDTERSADGVQLRAVVVTPQSAVVSGSVGRVRLALATASVQTTVPQRTVRNQLTASETDLAGESYTGSTPLWQLMVDAKLVPKPAQPKPSAETPAAEQQKPAIDGRSILQSAILSAMRSYCKADAAMLQDRDLYRPEHYAVEQPTPNQLQDLLDRLLWKGDFISCRPVPGSALTQILATSQQFGSQSKNEWADPSVTGQTIETLGLFSNPETGLVTGGATVQPGQLYSVATTDYLAGGETGYPALAASGTGPAQAVFKANQFTEIAALVCQAVLRAMPGAPADSCRPSLTADAYLDPIAMQPYSLPRGLNETAKLRDWASQNWGLENTLAPVKANPAEFDAQNRRVFRIELDRADLGYQRNMHSLNDAVQQQRFGGVQAAQPTAPERFDWSADYLLRITSSGRNVDRFIESDAAYEDSGVKEVFTTGTGASETYQVSLPQNAAGIEIGLETRLFPAHQKNVTGIRLLTSFRYQTQVSRPLTQFQAADGFVNESLPRLNALLGKAGLRYDGRKSWIELGMQTGPQTEVETFTLGSLSCDPGNLPGCVSTTASLPVLQQLLGQPFQVTTARRDQSGVFFNGRIHLPLLFKKLDYVIENQGTFYFNRTGDSAAETRYLEDMKHELVIPIIGDLAIVPTVDIFFFQNKVTSWHIHGYQTSITAQYRFDWHTGLKWKDVMKYPSPPPSQ